MYEERIFLEKACDKSLNKLSVVRKGWFKLVYLLYYHYIFLMVHQTEQFRTCQTVPEANQCGLMIRFRMPVITNEEGKRKGERKGEERRWRLMETLTEAIGGPLRPPGFRGPP